MSALPVIPMQDPQDDRPTPISHLPIPEGARPSLALWVENLSVSFDGFKALTDVTLTLEQGELRCLIGPNGAGKTTLMDCITGKTRPDSGAVYLGSRLNDLTRLSEVRIAQLGIGRKFQRPTVFQGHTVYENCELALKGNKGRLPRAVRAPHGGRTDAHRRDPGADRPEGPRQAARPACWRTDRSSGWRSGCCWRNRPACCWSTSRSPA